VVVLTHLILEDKDVDLVVARRVHLQVLTVMLYMYIGGGGLVEG
jgi:hypothetical protein